MTHHNDHSSDIELMRASRASNAPFGVIYERHARAVFGWALSQVGDSHVARDITAETFAIAWEQRATFASGESDSVRPWLLGIAKNVHRMWARSRSIDARAMTRLGIESQSSDWPDAAADVTEASASEAPLLSDLSETERAAVTLRVIDGLSYREIARQLTCSRGAARMRVLRGLKTMRESNTHERDAR